MAPNWLPDRWHDKWRKPWTVRAGRQYDVRFKRKLRKNGYLSPHFKTKEWGSKPDGCGCSTGPPKGRKLRKLQTLAFKVERVRHALGDKPIGNHSAYRNRCHEKCIGGAFGYHPRAMAIDPVRLPSIPISKWNTAWFKYFGDGGIGRQSGSGEVRHADYGPFRRWWY